MKVNYQIPTFCHFAKQQFYKKTQKFIDRIPHYRHSCNGFSCRLAKQATLEIKLIDNEGNKENKEWDIG